MRATFAIQLPPNTWITELSRAHPEMRFRLLTGIELEDGAVEMGELVGDEVERLVATITDHEDIHETELLYVDDGRALAQYRTTETSFYEFLRGASIPPEFPIVVSDGWFEMEVTAAREQIRDFQSTLEAVDWPHELRAAVQDPDPDGLLTDRQRELLETAVRKGYFTVPRECTLAELADEAGVDKSTASGVLRRGEARIVTWFLTGAGGSREESSLSSG